MPTVKKAKPQPSNGQPANGQPARRPKSRFGAVTIDEIDRKVERYNRFLSRLDAEEAQRELAKLSPEDAQLLAFTTEYLNLTKPKPKEGAGLNPLRRFEKEMNGTPDTLASRNGQPARRRPKNRFWAATYEEHDRKVEEYNRFLATLSDKEMKRELEELSLEEAHMLAWTTTYLNHHKPKRKRGAGQ